MVLPRLLFTLCLGMAGTLVLLVIVCPWLDDGRSQSQDWWQICELFARDTTLRRTAIAAAIGLAVTASVFFRPARNNRRREPEA